MSRLVSIIIPVFNRGSIVLDTLKSVKKQFYRPIEIVVIDDGSTDNTAQIVKGWIKNNAEAGQFSLNYAFQENLGVSAARNHGIRIAKGSYLQFLDSDDRLYPDCLEKIVSKFESDEADLILTGYDIFDETSGQIVSSIQGIDDGNQLEHVIKGEVCVITIRAAFTRNLIDETGYWNEHMKMSEDTEYIQRALCHAQKPVGLKENLSSLRRGREDHRHFDFDQKCRVECNERFLHGVLAKPDVSNELKSLQVVKVATLACKLYLMKEHKLAQRCARAVRNVDVQHGASARFKIILSQMGYPGSLVFLLFYKIRSKLNLIKPSAHT